MTEDFEISFEADEDFRMDYKNESASTDNNEHGPSTSTDPVGFREASIRYQELQKEMDRIDDIAVQLKFALELRAKMEECYSSRSMNKCPISTRYEVRCLSSGSLLYIIHILNNSQRSLNNWFFLVTAESIESAGPVHTSSFCLPFLEPNQSRTFEIFSDRKSVRLPCIIRTKLIRSFEISSPSKIIRISLDHELVSYLNFMKICSTSSEKKASHGSFTLNIPCSYINLLCGCQENVKPFHILQLLLHVATPQAELNLDCTSMNCQITYFQSFHQVRFEAEKMHKNIDLVVYVRDSDMRRKLQRDIQLFLITKYIGILKRMPSEIEWSRNERNINDIFVNIVEKFT